MDILLLFERGRFLCTLAFMQGLFALALLPCRSARHVVSLSKSRPLSAQVCNWCGRLVSPPRGPWHDGKNEWVVKRLPPVLFPVSRPNVMQSFCMFRAFAVACKQVLWHTACDLCVSSGVGDCCTEAWERKGGGWSKRGSQDCDQCREECDTLCG